MVKPDVKHNYYADLDLPTNASIDDVRKAYRKLALQYHPDRNAGKEAEVVPRFQAIQAANEVLSDATIKNKYDQDRRKASLYPAAFRTSTPTPGNPYQASSAYPPPPRRTQPGTWQRPASTAYAGAPSGAERFTNFPKAAPTSRKDPAAERSQTFRAWQSMNGGTRPAPPPPPPRSPAPQPQPQNAPRPRPNRQDTKMPTEEQIKAGMRHGKPAAFTAGPEAAAAEKQSAWQAFQSANPGKPSSSRKQRQAPNTPKRAGGFDPNAPGSDERPAPASTGHYNHRHRSEDFGAEGMFPPPPPGPPPTGTPASPAATTSQRPFLTPLRPLPTDDVPYTEGNRKSSPYTSFSGEKTRFNSDGLRRSASTRDTTSLRPGANTGTFRARSSSPPVGRQSQANGNKPFGADGESNSSEDTQDSSDMDRDYTQTPEEYDNTAPKPDQPQAGPPRSGSFPPPKDRPIKKPTPRLNGSNSPFNPPFSQPVNGSTLGAQSDGDQPSMQQRKSSTNMYGTPSPSSTTPSSFRRQDWVANSFGSLKSRRQKENASIPQWAFPASVLPGAKQQPRGKVVPVAPGKQTVRAADVVNETKDPLWDVVSQDIREAYWHLRAKLHSVIKSQGGDVEQLNQLDLDVFLKIVMLVYDEHTTGVAAFDAAMRETLIQFPSIRSARISQKLADGSSVHSFNIPITHDTFAHTAGKSRSVEDININFTPDGLTPSFQGTPDYFSATGRKPSPARRTPSNRTGRPATMDIPSTSSGSAVPPFSQAEGHPASMFNSPSDAKFNEEAWRSQFKDASWTQPSTGSRIPSRQNSDPRAQTSTGATATGTKAQPHIIPDDAQESSRATVVDDADEMDIDTPPHPGTANITVEPDTPAAKEPRLYSVPPSTWRKQQEQQQAQVHHKTPSGSRTASNGKLNANLDDLSHVEPIAMSADGLRNLADMSSTLPFDSQAAPSISSHAKEPTRLQLPAMPKVPEIPLKLTKTTWQGYALKFGTYLQAFHDFNKTVLAHFAARQTQSEARLLRGTHWLEASGDTTEQLGFDSYLKGVREDEQVREAWNIGSEKHLEAVKTFDGMRERVRQLAAAGLLQDV